LVAARLQSTREGGRAAYASHTPSLPNPHRPVIAQDPDHPAAPGQYPMPVFGQYPMPHPMQYPDSTPCQYSDSTPCHPHPCARIHTRQLPELERDIGGSKGGSGERGKDVTFCVRLNVAAGSSSVPLVHSAYFEARRTSGGTSLKFSNQTDCLRRTAAGRH
jgi:hypothetical protein